MTEPPRPADSLKGHWTDRAPARFTPYLRLSRLDRPAGWQLLYLPCMMGLGLAQTGEAIAWMHDATYAGAMLIGAIAMRGAGCTYNDIADQKIDAQIARTRGRPLPSGQVSTRQAWAWLAAQCLIGLGVLLFLPPPATYTALASLPFVAAYPFMKRFTWWPQAWLGVCFSWGALVAGAAVQNQISAEIILLFLGCVAWVIGYDTIYALQDIEDDAIVGVRSTARLFGDKWRNWVYAFYAIAFALWIIAARVGGAHWLAPALLVGLALLCSGQLERTNAAEPQSALAAFKANVPLGIAIAFIFILAAILGE
ncbi:MAG TPA: 4-hydroxybenzoate octaprenyltransferase [Caulobacterales bacterium]|nr:4-hydroxybenzoate octaprenyltransferase [Caulobacterales bacterium]